MDSEIVWFEERKRVLNDKADNLQEELNKVLSDLKRVDDAVNLYYESKGTTAPPKANIQPVHTPTISIAGKTLKEKVINSINNSPKIITTGIVLAAVAPHYPKIDTADLRKSISKILSDAATKKEIGCYSLGSRRLGYGWGKIDFFEEDGKTPKEEYKIKEAA